MSPTEKKAWRRFDEALATCRRQEFILDSLDTSKPREIRAWAIDARKQWERRPGREADAARVALDRLASAAQGWADVHERGERERAAQAAKKAPPRVPCTSADLVAAMDAAGRHWFHTSLRRRVVRSGDVLEAWRDRYMARAVSLRAHYGRTWTAKGERQ